MDKASLLVELAKYSEEHLSKSFIPGKTYIPPTFPKLTPADVSVIGDALLNFWYTDWKYCHRFSESLSRFLEVDKCVLTNSGSSASLVSMSTMKEFFGGKYVLTCATGFPTTVSPIYQTGKIPIYIDIIPNTLSPDFNQISHAVDKFGDQISGAIFAHTLGFPFHERSVRSLLPKKSFLISDCCDAVGARIRVTENDAAITLDFPVGHYADMMTLSFFPAHHVMAGEGGAVLTNSDEYESVAASVVNWGRSCWCRPGESNTCGHRFDYPNRGSLPVGWDHKYQFDRLGYNFKMTEFQAALGYSQMQNIEKMNQDRLRNYSVLVYGIERNRWLSTPDILSWSFPSPFGVPILVHPEAPFGADDFIQYLEVRKIGTRRVFGGNLVRQPGFMGLPYETVGDLIGSDRVMNDMFWISCSPSLTDDMLNYMIDTINGYLV